jgi:2-keto-4-pentenoate hydratase/2-oxohepta-3-ene-1,7-dioic acid hydratase in catechol pathway
MKLVTFTRSPQGTPTLGALTHAGDELVDLQNAHSSASGSSHPALNSMQDLIEHGEEGLAVARACMEGANTISLASVQLLAPLPRPLQIRDCLCFEKHLLGAAEAGARLMGKALTGESAMLQTLRRQPIWYKANRMSVVGPEHEVVWPEHSNVMDYELEIGMVLGRTGVKISREEAGEYIFGYTIFNDLSARDTQLLEMEGQLGPTQGKDFDGGNVFGPCIVTADEFSPDDARMTVRVNGEVRSEGRSGDMMYSFEDLIAYISRDETLYAGEILGSGTVGGGCGLEAGKLLESGDVVELEIEGIGRLRNRIIASNVHK